MKYLHGTKKMLLTLNATNSNDSLWGVDAAYAVHPDMRLYTGIVFTMGQGRPICSSRKQKLNAKSSTEAELDGADDAMSMILWVLYFLCMQGYGLTTPVLYKDNKSAILLEENGSKSNSEQTKHRNICYYFITNQVNNRLNNAQLMKFWQTFPPYHYK